MPDPKKPEVEVSDGADAKETVTLEDVKALLDKRDKALTTKFDGSFAELKQLLTARPAEPQSKPTEATPDKPTTVEESPAIRSLKRQLEETNARVKAAEDKHAAAAAKAADMQLRAQLTETLTAAGVDAKFVRHAVGFLVDVEKRVRMSEGGEITFLDGTDEVTLATGMKSWLRSDDAKFYLTPRGANGSGDKSGGKAPAKPSGTAAPLSREELAVKLQEALMGGSFRVG